MSTVDFEYIESAVHPDEFTLPDPSDYGPAYDNAARWTAKSLLAAARRDPVAFREALDEYRQNPYGRALDELLTPEEREAAGQLTGFQWGWAVQTVAYLLEQQSVPNPALVVINTA